MANQEIHTLELDIAYADAAERDEVNARFAANNVTFNVLVENGPGGGWPVYEVTGTKDAIMASLPGYFWTPKNTSVDSFEFFAGLDETPEFDAWLAKHG
jgi:hypothetical protein